MSDARISVFYPGGSSQQERRRSGRRQNQPWPGNLWLMACKRRSSPRWQTLTRNLKSRLSAPEDVVSATLPAFQVVVVYCLLSQLHCWCYSASTSASLLSHLLPGKMRLHLQRKHKENVLKCAKRGCKFVSQKYVVWNSFECVLPRRLLLLGNWPNTTIGYIWKCRMEEIGSNAITQDVAM